MGSLLSISSQFIWRFSTLLLNLRRLHQDISCLILMRRDCKNATQTSCSLLNCQMLIQTVSIPLSLSCFCTIRRSVVFPLPYSPKTPIVGEALPVRPSMTEVSASR
jgi:hypothetical protein